MPTYEYLCKSCGQRLEVQQRFTDDPLSECPVCEGPLRKVFDRTRGRDDTYFASPQVVHVPWADPYCDELRAVSVDAARAEGATVHETGTVVVVQGPRFSTKAESRWYREQGW